jgi:hypothetical protein
MVSISAPGGISAMGFSGKRSKEDMLRISASVKAVSLRKCGLTESTWPRFVSMTMAASDTRLRTTLNSAIPALFHARIRGRSVLLALHYSLNGNGMVMT